MRSGTFAIASFWLVSALAEIGRESGPAGSANASSPWPAHSACTRRNSTGHEPAPWELPAGFTHVALINAVAHVIREGDRTASPGNPWEQPAPADAQGLRSRSEDHDD